MVIVDILKTVEPVTYQHKHTARELVLERIIEKNMRFLRSGFHKSCTKNNMRESRQIEMLYFTPFRAY